MSGVLRVPRMARKLGSSRCSQMNPTWIPPDLECQANPESTPWSSGVIPRWYSGLLACPGDVLCTPRSSCCALTLPCHLLRLLSHSYNAFVGFKCCLTFFECSLINSILPWESPATFWCHLLRHMVTLRFFLSSPVCLRHIILSTRGFICISEEIIYYPVVSRGCLVMTWKCLHTSWGLSLFAWGNHSLPNDIIHITYNALRFTCDYRLSPWGVLKVSPDVAMNSSHSQIYRNRHYLCISYCSTGRQSSI